VGNGRFGRASQEFAMSENETKELRLFVVGESSTDPERWNEYGSRAIVIAHDAEEANKLLEEKGSSLITEIKLNCETPKVLMYEENHGEF
jgi:hypothetical protein